MWIIGQRVIAPTEPELGVGTIVRVDGRSALDVVFEGARTRRRYAFKSAPLRRLVLRVGQKALTKTGETFVVAEVLEQGGLLHYAGEGRRISEQELSHEMPDQGALGRFVAGPWSHPRTYDLRRAGWELLSRSLDPEVRGLAGARVSLLPHQLYIARTVSRREIPRVLLADEVGLGKTIEAGLIFSSLRSLERANRVLVLAPAALKHQWLAELYRRFNELFSIVDGAEGDDTAADSESGAPSPFRMNQRVIASLDTLLADPQRLRQACEEPWDLLIVDEAHHLEWTPAAPSREWQAVQALSARARGLLLLTATPRQRGLETQFGLLHLVDPQRFGDFAEFRRESAELRETAQLARHVHARTADDGALQAIQSRFAGDDDVTRAIAAYRDDKPDHLLRALIDRHGTGRVLVRNRRERLQGFPRRRLHAVKLAAGDKSAREAWLQSFLQALPAGEKVLLLCSSPATVRRLDKALQGLTGIKRALFHEGMDTVERDRQAAWFAEPAGAQLLVSSEIGGEGRNFQFAHKLVLFDLPPHPDLLEQRIGRLDRIGQKQDIEIHVPWVEGGAEEVYLEWYARGLRSFERAWNGGAPLLEKFKPRLDSCAASFSRPALEALIADTAREVERLEAEQRESVDILVDLNSFDEAEGERLSRKVRAADRDPAVPEFLEAMFDHYGVEFEDFDEAGTLKLSAHSLTFTDSFPELPPGSERLATFTRAQALAREDLMLLTQDHPMVKGALSLLLDRDEGRVSCGARDIKRAPSLEFLFVLQASAPAYLEVERYLPLTVIEVVVDAAGRLKLGGPGLLDQVWMPMREDEQASLARAYQEVLPGWLEKATALAQTVAEKAVREALLKGQESLREEHARLVRLSQVNASVRSEEIERHQAKVTATCEAIRKAALRLDALRAVLG